MKKKTLRVLSLLLILAALLGFVGCGYDIDPVLPAPTYAPDAEETPSPAENEDDPSPELPDRDGYYYDPESVVLYLDAYGELPGNYITKSEARAFGWEGGSVERYLEGAAIGGDSFANREGLLPRAEGRSYRECDLNTLGENSRGAERLIYSNDGLYFYTDDHYEHFTELTVTREGYVEWN